MRWSFYLIIIYFFLFANTAIKNLFEWNRLFSINLIFFSVGNIMSNIPSGSRYLTFSFFLTFIMIIIYLNQYKYDSKFKSLIQVLSPAFILYIIVAIRIGLYSTSITSLIGGPLISIFSIGNNMSLNDLIK